MKKITVICFILLAAQTLHAQRKWVFTASASRVKPQYKLTGIFDQGSGLNLNYAWRICKDPLYLGLSWTHTCFTTQTYPVSYVANGVLLNSKMDISPLYNSYNILLRFEGTGNKEWSGIVAYAEASAGLAALRTDINLIRYMQTIGSTTQPGQQSVPCPGTHSVTIRDAIKHTTWNAYAGIGFQKGLLSMAWSNEKENSEVGGIFLHFSCGLLYAHRLPHIETINQQTVNSTTVLQGRIYYAREHAVAEIKQTPLLALQLQAGLTINL
ncbi:MAG TPA: hypothetical protein VD905_12085 [Flavobacteriales bacterium]|nr:hypothetical protein [Flavobacteriales bacterium]